MTRVLAQEPMEGETIEDIQWEKRPMTKDELKAATWQSVTDPALMEEIILRYNEQHLTQSTISPFAHGPLRDLLKEDGSGSHLFTEGEIPPEVATHYGHLEEAVKLVLEEMKHKTHEKGRHNFEWTFDGRDFKEAFGKARLNTAPGFSGLSMAKLQAISTDDKLSEYYAQIISLPFKYGFTYPAWLMSIQAMLQKEDLPYVHRLRIIELFELDLNGFLKYVVGRQFAYHDQSNGLQNRESYGAVKGRSAHDALNSIQNVLEYSRMTNTPIAIAPKDATGCFDLLRREVVKIVQESKGMPKELGASVVATLHGMKRFVRTAGRISQKSFTYTQENNIGGYGQGNGEGPQGGNDQLGALKNIHEKTTAGCTMHHPNGEDALTRHGGGFIDDQIDTILLNSNVAQETIPLVEDVLQKWQNLLNVSGGDLSLPKCKVGFANYKFIRNTHTDRVCIKKIEEDPGDVFLQPYDQIKQKVCIKRLQPWEAERYLGVRLTLNGNHMEELRVRTEQVSEMAEKILQSSICRHQAYMIHGIQYRPAIIYPLQHVMFTEKESHSIQKPIINALIAKMGFNRKTPRVVVYGPTLYGGLGLTDLREEIFVEHLLSFLKDMRGMTLQTDERQLLLDTYQLIIGSSTNFLELDAENYPYKPTNNKLTFLWTHLTKRNMTIRRKNVWLPHTNFANDITIMDGLQDVRRARAGTPGFISDTALRNANTVRLYLKVYYLSDILDEEGKIDDKFFYVREPNDTQLQFPNQAQPSAKAKADWRAVIRAAFIYGDRGINRMMIMKETQPGTYDSSDTLQQTFSKLSNDEQNVLGLEALQLTNSDCKPIIETMRNEGELRIYGDGSVKDGRGSHAFRVKASGEETAQYIESSAISSGDKRWITSLRTETLSMLGALYLIRSIARANSLENKPFHLLFTYDNEESVRRLNTLGDFYSTADPLATDYDVWAEMKSVKTDLLKTTAAATWVKGHQDTSIAYEDLPLDARENIDMDKKCEVMRTSDEPTPSTPYFSSERAQVVVDGIPVTQQLRQYLHVKIAGSALRDYICKKTGWTIGTFEKVNWSALELYLKNLPGEKRTNVIKMQHGWIFTAERDHLFQSKSQTEYETRTDSACCPFKCDDIDYKWHFLNCKKSPLHSQVTKELKPLLQTMRSLKTDPNIRSAIMNRLRTYLKGLPPKQITLPSEANEEIQIALAEQDEIGWDHFLLGRLSKRWEIAQQLWYNRLRQEKKELKKHMKGIHWSRKTITHTVYLTLNRWQLHNDYLHNISKLEAYKRDRDKLLEKITTIKARKHLLPADVRLQKFFTGDIRTAESLPLTRLKEWHKAYESLLGTISPHLITRYLTPQFSPHPPG